MSLFSKFAAAAIPAIAVAGTLYSNNFSSDLGPFSACNVKSPSSTNVSDGTLEMYFDEKDFDGTRNDKGVEICVFEDGTSTNVNQMKKEGWQGFSIKADSGSFPTNKETIIAQQFCPGGCSSWCATLTISGNSLVADHRTGCVDPTTATVVDDISRDTWHDLVVRMRVSQDEDGAYEVWWDGDQVYSKKGIDVGFGTWDGDELSTGWYFKNGQYAFGCRWRLTTNVDTESYDDGTRTLLFDNVKWYQTDSGEADGYDTVAP